MHDLIRRAEAWLIDWEHETLLTSPQVELVREMIAALKAQQPAPAGQTAPQVTQGDNGGRVFTVTQIHGKEVTLAGGGGGATYLVEVQGGVSGKVHIPAPVDAEGLPPPLPEPIGVLHRGNGGEWWFSCGDNLRNLYAQPMGEHNLYTSDQLRRAQREAMAVERERCAQTIDDMPSETGWIGKMDAARKLRQGAKT